MADFNRNQAIDFLVANCGCSDHSRPILNNLADEDLAALVLQGDAVSQTRVANAGHKHPSNMSDAELADSLHAHKMEAHKRATGEVLGNDHGFDEDDMAGSGTFDNLGGAYNADDEEEEDEPDEEDDSETEEETNNTYNRGKRRKPVVPAMESNEDMPPMPTNTHNQRRDHRELPITERLRPDELQVWNHAVKQEKQVRADKVNLLIANARTDDEKVKLINIYWPMPMEQLDLLVAAMPKSAGMTANAQLAGRNWGLPGAPPMDQFGLAGSEHPPQYQGSAGVYPPTANAGRDEEDLLDIPVMPLKDLAS